MGPNAIPGEDEVANFDQMMSEFDREMWSLIEGERERSRERERRREREPGQMYARRERRCANKSIFRKMEEKREKRFAKEMKQMKQEKEEKSR